MKFSWIDILCNIFATTESCNDVKLINDAPKQITKFSSVWKSKLQHSLFIMQCVDLLGCSETSPVNSHHPNHILKLQNAIWWTMDGTGEYNLVTIISPRPDRFTQNAHTLEIREIFFYRRLNFHVFAVILHISEWWRPIEVQPAARSQSFIRIAITVSWTTATTAIMIKTK